MKVSLAFSAELDESTLPCSTQSTSSLFIEYFSTGLGCHQHLTDLNGFNILTWSICYFPYLTNRTQVNEWGLNPSITNN